MQTFIAQKKKLVVLGNGPSLKGFDLTSLSEVDSLGMNAAYRFWERIGWFPTHYVCLDDQLIETHASAIYDLVVTGKVKTAFLISKILDYYPELIKHPGVFYLECFNRIRHAREAKRGIPLIDSLFFRESDASKVTTGAYAIRFAAHLGYAEVAILGVDLRYVEIIPEARQGEGIKLVMATTPKSNPNYFFDDYQQAGDKFNVPNPSSHSRNLHVAAFEILANDSVQFKWPARVLNGNKLSVLYDKAIFPFVSMRTFISKRRLGAVVVPTTAKEIKSLLANLVAWDSPRLAPSVGQFDVEKPDLIFAFSSTEDANLRRVLMAAYGSTKHVKEAFRAIEVLFIGLPESMDYYQRDYSKKVTGRGHKSGPNEQFFEVLSLLKGRGEFMFYMESDCVPLRQGWLDSIRNLAEGDDESWIIGSIYRGIEPIDDRFFMHLNGNALYRIGDPDFIRFTQNYWRESLYQILDTQDKRIAYDCLISLRLSGAQSRERNDAWAVFQSLAHRLRATSVVQNISGAADRGVDTLATIRRLLVEDPQTFLVHGAPFLSTLLAKVGDWQEGKIPTALAWGDIIPEMPSGAAEPISGWERALEENLPRLLIVDTTAAGSRTATGQVKELFLKGWPKERLLQVYEFQDELKLRRFRESSSAGGGASDADAILQACVDFAPQVIYFRPTDSARLFKFVDRLNSLQSVPTVVHMMDDWPERLRFSGSTSFAAVDGGLRQNLRSAKVCLAIGDAMSSVFQGRYGQRFTPLANGIDLKKFPEKNWASRPDISAENPLIIRYMGGLAKDMTSDSVIDIARAVSQLSKSLPVRFEIFTMPWYMKEAAGTLLGMSAVSLHDLVDAERYPSLLAEADVLTIAYNFDEATHRYVGLSIANKLPECLASGAVVLGYGPESIATIDYVNRTGCAITVLRRDVNLLCAAIESLASSRHECERLGVAGRKFAAQHHSSQDVVRKFRSVIRGAAMPGNSPRAQTHDEPKPQTRPVSSAANDISTMLQPAPPAISLSFANELYRRGLFSQAYEMYRELYLRNPLPIYDQNAKRAERRLAD